MKLRSAVKRYAWIICLLFASSAQTLTLTDIRSQSRDLAIDNGTRLRFTTSTIDNFVNEGQRIAILDSKALIKSANFELSAGSTYYSLPSDFLQMRRLTLRYQELEEQTPESLANRVGLEWETSGGLPTNYFINFSSRTKVGFYPFPDTVSSTGTVRYEYYASPTDLSASSDEPFGGSNELDQYHYLLVYYAAYRMAMIDGRQDLGVLYRTEFYEGIERMKREALARPAYRPAAMPINRTNRVGP